jgi:hypothetical protein
MASGSFFKKIDADKINEKRADLMFKPDKDMFIFETEPFFIIKIRKGIKSERFVDHPQIKIELVGGRFFVFKIERVVGIQKEQGKSFFLVEKALVSFS